MWISERASSREDSAGKCSVGKISIGGVRPAVLTQGEIRNAELVACGFVYVPEAGDEVLFMRGDGGEALVGGKIISSVPADVKEGEVYITNKSGVAIHIKNDGEIILRGNIIIEGGVNILGPLTINGIPYIRGNTSGGGLGGA